MTFIRKLWIAMAALALLSGPAQAQDVYNFYFQKKGTGKTEKQVPQPPQEDSEDEYVEEVMEVGDDVLLVPDNWKPAGKRYRKVLVKKPKRIEEVESTNQVATIQPEVKSKDKSGRGWQAKLGIGSVVVGNHFNTPFAQYQLTQKTYVLGATYHMSKYFQVNSELHLPNGDAEANGSTIFGNYHMDPQFAIGLGATPIHLNVFGGEFLAIGVDGGVAVGNESGLDRSSNRVYLGPRLAMSFSDNFSLIYAYRKNISGEGEFSTNSLALAYKW